MASNPASLTFTPLHPTFGAECAGVDFSQPVPAATVDEIRAAMARYGVLVFRNTQLDDAAHVAFAAHFGDLDDASTWLQPGQQYRLAPYIQLSDVGNIDLDGSVTPRDSLRTKMNQGNGLFHVDCSYNARRAGFSMLRAHTLPPRGTGGGTEFADTRTAYEQLDGETKAKLADVVLCHSLWHSRKLGAPECQILADIKPEDHGMARHRLMQLHEPSGRMNMYIAWHAHHIDGLTREESQPVIEKLLQHASQEKYTFRVDWENNGDLVIWDNTCVMHRACGGSYEGIYARDMRRATVHDSSSTAWGLNPQTDSRAGMFTAEMKDAKWNQPQAEDTRVEV